MLDRAKDKFIRINTLIVIATTVSLPACSEEEPAFNEKRLVEEFEVSVDGADASRAEKDQNEGSEMLSSTEELKRVFAELDGTDTQEQSTENQALPSENEELATTGSKSHTGVTSKLSNKEIAVCSKVLGVDIENVKIAGKNKSQQLSGSDVLAIKASGSRSDLKLTLGGVSKVQGLCLFLTGNQSSAEIIVNTELNNFLFIGRGNRSSAQITISSGAKINSLAGDLSGNNTALNIEGNGTYPCETVLIRNKKSSFTCEQ